MTQEELLQRQREEARKLALELIRRNEYAKRKAAFEDYKTSKILKCDKCGKTFNALGSQLSWRTTCGSCYYASKK